MKKAIVTGANGFVGTALCRELSARGVEVIAVVRNESSHTDGIKGLPGLRLAYCDLSHVGELGAVIPDRDTDVMFHLAWSGVSGVARGDYALQLNNAKWMLDAVNAAHDLGCRRFVGAGTLAQLDVSAYTPMDGSTPNPVSCYGVAKIAAQYMSKAECNRLGIDHLWAYLSNIYGEGDKSSNFINFAIKAILSDGSANFTSGEQMYDFVHISDIVQGLYCIGEKGKTNYAYYVGSGAPQKLKAFLAQIRDVANPHKQLNLGAIPFHGVTLPDAVFWDNKLFEHTGYRPHVPFDIGVRRTVEWIRQSSCGGEEI